jgi:hypothetical protein
MDAPRVPTLSRVFDYLRDLGFAAEAGQPGVAVFAHPASGAELLFRERDLSTPARPNELANLHAQLTHRGLVTPEEFERFLAGSVQPSTTPS